MIVAHLDAGESFIQAVADRDRVSVLADLDLTPAVANHRRLR